MKQTIIITHASYAKGIYEAMQFIVGTSENVHVINSFTENIHPENDFIDLLNSFDPNDKVVVLTDLKGGSVNQFVAKHLTERHFYLITGVNLGTAIEVMVMNEDDINDERLREVVQSGKNDLVYMNDEIEHLQNKIQNEDFFE